MKHLGTILGALALLGVILIATGTFERKKKLRQRLLRLLTIQIEEYAWPMCILIVCKASTYTLLI
jgi:hypothetical protein